VPEAKLGEGAGAVGLLAVYSALITGAAEVYVVDRVPEPLEKAGELGAAPVDFSSRDPVDQIKELRRRSGLPIGEEGMNGVQKGIDAVGFRAAIRAEPSAEDLTGVIADLARLVNPTGHIGIVCVSAERDREPSATGRADGWLTVPWATLFNKGVSVNFGCTHDRPFHHPAPRRCRSQVGAARMCRLPRLEPR
jgi:glutathione-independent formaldehyde dehydrogenase